MTDENDIKSKIDRFVGYFNSSLDAIETINHGGNPSHKAVFRGTLYVTWLDAISRAPFPKKKPKDRFLSFIRKFSTWPDQNRVSLTHLQRLFEISEDPEFNEITKLVEARIIETVKQSETGVFPISEDPTFDEMVKYWPTYCGSRKQIQEIDLRRLKHSELLYAFRNGMVHEFRALGYGFDFDTEYPYYHSSKNAVGKTSLELVYPLKFLTNLCRASLPLLATYLEEQRIDPYGSYTFGTYWIEELNAGV